MNTEEMKIKLEELKIPPRWFSINDSISSDIYIFRQVYTYWECYYIDERGGENNYHKFYSESDACEFFINCLTKELES